VYEVASSRSLLSLPHSPDPNLLLTVKCKAAKRLLRVQAIIRVGVVSEVSRPEEVVVISAAHKDLVVASEEEVSQKSAFATSARPP